MKLKEQQTQVDLFLNKSTPDFRYLSLLHTDFLSLKSQFHLFSTKSCKQVSSSQHCEALPPSTGLQETMGKAELLQVKKFSCDVGCIKNEN